MANIKRITSFTAHTTAEGERLSYTYSEIAEDGTLIKSNFRATCIVLNEGIKQKIDEINKFLLDRESATV